MMQHCVELRAASQRAAYSTGRPAAARASPSVALEGKACVRACFEPVENLSARALMVMRQPKPLNLSKRFLSNDMEYFCQTNTVGCGH